MSCIFRLKKLAAPFALLAGLSACAGTPPAADTSQEGNDPVDLAIANAGLGVAINGCADDGSTGWAATTSTLTLTMGGGTGKDVLVLSAPGGKIAANGNLCAGTIATVANTPLTTTNVQKISIVGTTAADKVILDLLPGTFGTKILSARGGITVDFSPTNSSGNDSLMIRGASAAEKVKVGETSTGDIHVELTGDKNADLKVTTGASAPALTLSLGSGADTFTASPVTADITGFGGAAVVITPLTSNVTVYGGAGNDTITGGAGDDSLNGGDNDDTFKMAATDDGDDIYSGDSGNDTVDYSNRTGDVDVDLGPKAPGLIGTVDMAGLTYAATGNSLDTKVLYFAVDGVTVTTVTFAAPTSPANAVYQINHAFDSNDVNIAATLVGQNRLKLYGASSVVVLPGAANTAAATLGLTAGSASGTKAPMIGTADTASGGGLATEVLDLLIDGDDCQVTFATPTDTDDIVTAINTACSATVAVKVVRGAVEHLLLQSPTATIDSSVEIVDTSDAHTALGLTHNAKSINYAHDKDDGLSTENDDVRYSVENITGGSGNDTLIGSDLKNVLKGGAGNDKFEGGSNAACSALNADSMLGEAGNDTFYSPVADCFAVYNGGVGAEDTADFSARLAALTLSNDSVALDGESGEKGNLDKTIEILIGGFGGDTLTGGTSNDSLYGGAGDDILNGAGGDDVMVGGTGSDVMNGGAGGDDKVDYSSYGATHPVDVTLCSAPTVATGASTDCGSDDGEMGQESDQILNVEHVIGGDGDDDLAASTTAEVSVTLEGGDGADTLTGGPGNDILYGDDGDDELFGGAGNDFLEGGVGDDEIAGEAGDGDICISNADDLTDPPVTCEGP